MQKIKRIRLSAVLGFRSDVKRASHAMLPRSREGGGALILLMLIASVAAAFINLVADGRRRRMHMRHEVSFPLF